VESLGSEMVWRESHNRDIPKDVEKLSINADEAKGDK